MGRFLSISLGLVVMSIAAGVRGDDKGNSRHAWTGADVGRVGLRGSHSEAEGVFTLNGAGGGLFIAGDGFHFVSLPRQGDFELTARAVSLKNDLANSTLGLIARESLEYDAKDVYLFLRPNRDYIAACQARVADDVEAVKNVAKDTGVTFPCWLRMTRRGQVFEVFLSRDGEAWKSFGSVTNPMSEFLYVGLLVSSHRTSQLAEAVFDNVSSTGNIPPADQFRDEVQKSIKRSSGAAEGPRDPHLAAFDELIKQRRAEREALRFPVRTKLIELSNPPPKAATFVEALKEYEDRPYDGVVLKLEGGERPFQRKKWNEARFLEDYKALAGLESPVFTDNFVIVHTNAAIDWFDDEQWNNVLHNTRLMARAALLGRCAGLFVDPEGYGANAFSYYDAFGKEEHSFEEFQAQVKRRGQEWVRAVEEELPSPRLLFSFLMPTTRLMDDLDWPIEKVIADQPRARYGLLPSFAAGVLSGAGPRTKLIEGNEHAYYYRSSSDYETYARYVRNVLPHAYLDEPLRPKSLAQLQIGLSLYPNWYFGLSYKSLAQHMTPQERGRWYEHNLYWALKTSDEYVWDFLEGPPTVWRRGPDWSSSGKLPEDYLDAIRRARKKVSDGTPLGFESASLFDAVKSRAMDKRPTTEIKRLGGKPPKIDGNIDDEAWGSAGFGFAFQPLMAWKQEGHQKTQAAMTYDAEALYVAFRAFEDRPGTMRAKTASPDDYFLANDDHVQVCIASARAPDKLLYRFQVNSQNVSNDAFVRENPDPKGRDLDPLLVDVRGYNPEWQHAVQIQKDSWAVEMRIPWKSLSLEPEAGMNLRVNLGRFRSQGLNWERTYWAPVLEMKGDTFERLTPELLGTVKLRE